MSNKWKADRIIFYKQLLEEKNELKKNGSRTQKKYEQKINDIKQRIFEFHQAQHREKFWLTNIRVINIFTYREFVMPIITLYYGFTKELIFSGPIDTLIINVSRGELELNYKVIVDESNAVPLINILSNIDWNSNLTFSCVKCNMEIHNDLHKILINIIESYKKYKKINYDIQMNRYYEYYTPKRHNNKVRKITPYNVFESVIDGGGGPWRNPAAIRPCR